MANLLEDGHTAPAVTFRPACPGTPCGADVVEQGADDDTVGGDAGGVSESPAAGLEGVAGEPAFATVVGMARAAEEGAAEEVVDRITYALAAGAEK